MTTAGTRREDLIGIDIKGRARAARQARVKRLVAALASDIDALILFSNPSRHGPGTSTAGHVRFLTGLTDAWRSILVVLRRDGRGAVVCGAATVLGLPREATVADHGWAVVHGPTSRYGAMVGDLLGDLRMSHARIGLVGAGEMPQSIYSQISGIDAGWTFEHLDELVNNLRIVKEDWEIECHREAAATCDAMQVAAFAQAQRLEDPAWRIMVEMEHVAALHQAELGRAWVSTRDGWPLFFPSDPDLARPLRPGDAMIAGTFVEHAGYWGQSIRMGAASAAPAALREVHSFLRSVQDFAIDKLHPGTPLAEVTVGMSTLIDERYPGREAGRSGHALGLDYGDPIVSGFFRHQEDEPTDLDRSREVEAGMVFEIHPGVHVPEAGLKFATIGDMVLVTDSGPEVLTSFSRELIQI